MVLSPKDRRLITDAVALISDPARDRWREWIRSFNAADLASEVPYEIADIALQALSAAERDTEWRLRGDYLHEDARADMLNDLALIRSIRLSIRAANVGA